VELHMVCSCLELLVVVVKGVTMVLWCWCHEDTVVKLHYSGAAKGRLKHPNPLKIVS
jgi:hypothetical protein